MAFNICYFRKPIFISIEELLGSYINDVGRFIVYLYRERKGDREREWDIEKQRVKRAMLIIDIWNNGDSLMRETLLPSGYIISKLNNDFKRTRNLFY